MSGNSKLLADIHAHLGDNLLHCLNVGLTHWSASGSDTGIPDQKREFFFAPSHIQMRLKEWGAEEFDKKSSQFIYDCGKEECRLDGNREAGRSRRACRDLYRCL